MGRISKGVLGGFSGKVGTVIGSSWKGIDYMRSLATVRKNRTSSQRQLEQRAKFALVSAFMQSMHSIVMRNFNRYANRMTGTNSAMSYTIKSAVTGTYPDYRIEYSQVKISRGSLPNALGATATAGAAGRINFTWPDNSGLGKALPEDLALLVAYCADLNATIYRLGANRSAGQDVLDVTGFSGKQVQTWITFISADEKDIASSIFTGQVLVS